MVLGLIEENEIKERVVKAFKNLLSSTEDWRPSVSGLSFARLEAQEVARLEEPFSKEEVMGFFKEFHEHDCFVRSLTATFLVFILEKGKQKT